MSEQSDGRFERLRNELRRTRAILIWDWNDAPIDYAELSTHGGDEDGVALIPAGTTEPHWLERLWERSFSCQRVVVPEGVLVIWAHS